MSAMLASPPGSGQYDDLAGAAERILFDEADIPEERSNHGPDSTR